MFPDEPFCAVPVEVGSGVPYSGQVHTGWRVVGENMGDFPAK